MKTIYKYTLTISEQQCIMMPIGAELLTVQEQHGTPCLWANVDDSLLYDTVPINMTGTGWPHKGGRYIGTVQINGFVWHYFDARTL